MRSLMTKINTVICGDSAEVLRQYPDNFFDSVVCDPPYGLSKEPDITEVLTKWLAGEPYDHGHGGFMGKSWDSFVPHPDLWREVFRVLKPGGHALVFAGTRTQDLMTIALRLGGFEIRDVIEWLYFSGFPKSMDVGKAFDKRNGAMFPQRVELAKHIKEKRLEKGIERKTINEHFGYVAGIQHWEAQDFNNNAVPTVKDWETLKPMLGLSGDFDWLIERAEAEREVIGERVVKDIRNGHGRKYGAALFAGEDTPMMVYKETAPTTDLAKKWDGWGTALKPAHEPIIVARKPLIGTVADNVERYGTGAINIDGCRIGEGTGGKKPEYQPNAKNSVYGKNMGGGAWENTSGRFPANCVTTDDDAFYSQYFNVTPREVCKKASKADRNADWTGAEITLDMRRPGALQGRNDGSLGKVTYNRNVHPTVKPTDLMAWLVRLVTPPGGIVLDPFAGSGSTLVAAKREGLGFVGIEREPEYVKIAQARVGIEAEGGVAA